MDFSNLTAHGGFFPHGVGAVFGAVSVVISAMVGAEVATIAAAETANPERAVARATKSVVVRIVTFYLASVFLLAVIVPWNAQKPGTSPYVAALREMGIPAAGHLMNAVVLTAVLSCLNSGLYTKLRWSWSKWDDAGCPTSPFCVRRWWAFCVSSWRGSLPAPYSSFC
jgi:GABA permease